MTSGTKALTGHSDVLLGAVSVRDPALVQELVDWRIRTGSILGPFEAWLAHRSLATLGLRLERQQANARALVEALEGRVTHLRWPGVGPVISLALPTAEAAQAFLDACELGQRGDQLRRRPLDRRAPRPLGHATTCRRASSASRPASRTPRTSSPTCCRRSQHDEGPAGWRALHALGWADGRGSNGVRLAGPPEG